MKEIEFRVDCVSLFPNPDERRHVYVEIDLSGLIDYYTYHDAPSEVSLSATVEEMKAFAERVNAAVKEAEERQTWFKDNFEKIMADNPEAWLLRHKEWHKSKMTGWYYYKPTNAGISDIRNAIRMQLYKDESKTFKKTGGNS